MIDIAAIKADPRRKALAILSGVTALFVVLATLALMQRGGETAIKYAPRLLFPGLQQQLDMLAEIDITDALGTLHVKGSDAGWVVAERDNFPASIDQIRATAVGMSELELVEPKTANPEFLDALNLSAPEKKGRAIKISLRDKTGKILAEAFFGKTTQTSDSLGRTGVYVRRLNENQAYLARGYVMASSAVGDWLAKNVVSVGRERIQTVSSQPVSGAAYTVTREAKDQPDFRLVDIPKGRAIAYDSAPDGIAAAVTGFTFEDVKKASAFDFSKATVVTTRTFDGLSVSVRVIEKMDNGEKTYWAVVAAQAESAEAQAEASLINTRAKDWAFQLPEYKGQIFTTARDSLLKPPGQKDEPASGTPAK